MHDESLRFGRPWDWRRLWSLRSALILLAVTPVLVVLGISGYLGFQAADRWSEQRLQEEMELVARTLREPVSRALIRQDADTLRASLRSVFEFNRVYSAHVFGPDGERIATAGAASALNEPSPPIPVMDITREHGEFGEVGGRDVYSFFAPLADRGGRVIGILQIARRASDFSEQARDLRWRAAGYLGVTGLLLVIAAVAGHHFFIGRPISALSRSMATVGSGERRHRSEPRGPFELAELSRNFNRMLDNIDSAENEIAARERDQHNLESRLQRAERIASVGRLAAGVAHEIGTPLAVIDGRAQQLLKRDNNSSSTVRALEGVRSQVARIGHIVRQLLTYGRAYEGNRRPVRPEDCAREAMAGLRSEARATGVTLESSGPRPGPLAILDGGRMQEALSHILRNAIQAAGSGGRVHLSWSGDERQVTFRVEDDGPGIPAEQRQRVMDPFFTTKRVGEGSGLGLAVALGIIEEHDGRLEIDDAALGGAGVSVSVPRNQGRDE